MGWKLLPGLEKKITGYKSLMENILANAPRTTDGELTKDFQKCFDILRDFCGKIEKHG